MHLFNLDGGFKLLVGADLEEQRRVGRIMTQATLWSAGLIVLLGVAGGWFVTRRVLHRLDDINEAFDDLLGGRVIRAVLDFT